MFAQELFTVVDFTSKAWVNSATGQDEKAPKIKKQEQTEESIYSTA